MITQARGQYQSENAEATGGEPARELLRWLIRGPDSQRMLMRMVLPPPGYLPLYGEWIATVRRFVPTQANKNLEVFVQHLSHSRLGDGEHFACKSPQAPAVPGNWCGQIAARKVSIRDGLMQAAREITRFEAVTVGHQPATASDATEYGAYEKFSARPRRMIRNGSTQGVGG